MLGGAPASSGSGAGCVAGESGTAASPGWFSMPCEDDQWATRRPGPRIPPRQPDGHHETRCQDGKSRPIRPQAEPPHESPTARTGLGFKPFDYTRPNGLQSSDIQRPAVQSAQALPALDASRPRRAGNVDNLVHALEARPGPPQAGRLPPRAQSIVRNRDSSFPFLQPAFPLSLELQPRSADLRSHGRLLTSRAPPPPPPSTALRGRATRPPPAPSPAEPASASVMIRLSSAWATSSKGSGASACSSTGRHARTHLIERQRRVSLPPPMDVAANIHCDPVQPSRKVPPLVESAQMPEEPQIDFLRGVCCVFGPGEQPQRCAQHPPLVQQDELFERRRDRPRGRAESAGRCPRSARPPGGPSRSLRNQSLLRPRRSARRVHEISVL